MTSFPDDFKFGVSSAAYQIEGAVNEDGRGESIWDRFSHTPGKVKDGDTGDVACDHYHRYPEDIQHMKELGLDAYRFSTAWSRIFPKGRGQINPKGIAFYDRLVDALLEAEIEPWICLYHWDLPQALQHKGGWANRDIVGWFRDYAGETALRLKDRVEHWVTFNEPNIASRFGYLNGYMAPGIADRNQWIKAVHHMNLSHGAAISALREVDSNLKLGAVLAVNPVRPLREEEEDVVAAAKADAVDNGTFVLPIMEGTYPAEVGRDMAHAPVIAGDLNEVSQPLDFIGINYYTEHYAKHSDTDGRGYEYVKTEGSKRSYLGLEVIPEGLGRVLDMFKDKYGNPELYITETGYSYREEREDLALGKPDRPRIDFYRDHLEVCAQAIERGVNLKGFFAWTLMDNFEWALGYRARFGLMHTNFETQERTPKASYNYYRDVIEARRVLD